MFKKNEAVKVPLRLAVSNLCKDHWTDEPELAQLLYAILQFEFNVTKKQAMPANSQASMIDELIGKLK
jgi:hypothetical protein